MGRRSIQYSNYCKWMSHRHQVPSGVEVTPLTLWVCEFWGCDRCGCEGHGCERCGCEGAAVKTRDEQCDIAADQMASSEEC